MPRYQFKEFITGKVKNVLFPYLILSVPIIYFLLKTNDGWKPFFLPQGSGLVNEYLIPIAKYFLTGDTIIAYWYIPFIMLTFLMAPLHVVFAQLKISRQIFFLIFLFSLAAIMQRPIGNLNVFQSVVYFLPVYLFGIFCSINKVVIYALFEKKEIYLLLFAVFLSFIQVFTGKVGNYHKQPFDIQDIDILLFQKITLCLFFMVWLHRFEETTSKFLDNLAAMSFTVFFLHGYILFALQRVLNNLPLSDLDILVNKEPYMSWLIWMGVISVIVMLCMCIAYVTKLVAAKNSRYLIGY